MGNPWGNHGGFLKPISEGQVYTNQTNIIAWVYVYYVLEGFFKVLWTCRYYVLDDVMDFMGLKPPKMIISTTRQWGLNMVEWDLVGYNGMMGFCENEGLIKPQNGLILLLNILNMMKS